VHDNPGVPIWASADLVLVVMEGKPSVVATITPVDWLHADARRTTSFPPLLDVAISTEDEVLTTLEDALRRHNIASQRVKRLNWSFIRKEA
jgi:hypothetical protein